MRLPSQAFWAIISSNCGAQRVGGDGARGMGGVGWKGLGGGVGSCIPESGRWGALRPRAEPGCWRATAHVESEDRDIVFERAAILSMGQPGGWSRGWPGGWSGVRSGPGLGRAVWGGREWAEGRRGGGGR